MPFLKGKKPNLIISVIYNILVNYMYVIILERGELSGKTLGERVRVGKS